MSYITIIAEKPSVAKGIASVVGATTPHRNGPTGYLEGNGYKVTWAFGHLVGLKNPEELGFRSGELPMFPEQWETKVLGKRDAAGKEQRDEMVDRQMDTLKTLFDGASKIIVATDAGREGELIFRYIYEYLGCRTAFQRLWISSLTDEAIRGGMAALAAGHDYDRLSDAAHARSEADWLLGYNASRALRLSTGYRGNLSLGRVQTPVLAMICQRYEDNKNFVPTPFWQLKAVLAKDGIAFTALGEDKFPTEEAAADALRRAKAAGGLTVLSVEKKSVTTRPPLLYDLTSLQRAANSRYGLTADQTLKVAQSLYEKKYLTYPRTGSCYIGDDVFKTIPGLIRKVKGWLRFNDICESMEGKKLCRKSVDASKVTDHHALLPTENIPSALEGDERKIWEMVASRMLEAFGEDSLSEKTTVRLEAGGVTFRAVGSRLVKAGWKAVNGADMPEKKGKDDKQTEEDDTAEQENAALPALAERECIPAGELTNERKTDKPLPIYTESTLLGEMETCGKKIDDEELRESLKDIGLGTPATRAATIEILIRRQYIVREKKKLVPTQLGNDIWKMVRDCRIADVRTSGEWERDLGLVERGTLEKSRFDKAIHAFTLEVIDDLKRNCKPIDGAAVGTDEPVRTCPVCGRPMSNRKFNVFCDPEKGGCGLKAGREIAGKKLSAKMLDVLLSKGRTPVIKGFKSKAGKSFDAVLYVDREKRAVSFDFSDRGEALPEGSMPPCPVCGGVLEDKGRSIGCPSCGFTLWKTQGGVALTATQLTTLLQGGSVTLKGMTSKAGTRFDATLSVNREEKKISYTFPERKTSSSGKGKK